jgi:hypothetical protein
MSSQEFAMKQSVAQASACATLHRDCRTGYNEFLGMRVGEIITRL